MSQIGVFRGVSAQNIMILHGGRGVIEIDHNTAWRWGGGGAVSQPWSYNPCKPASLACRLRATLQASRSKIPSFSLIYSLSYLGYLILGKASTMLINCLYSGWKGKIVAKFAILQALSNLIDCPAGSVGNCRTGLSGPKVCIT